MNKDFINKITALRGDIGRKWIQDLPEIIKRYEQKWDIECLSPFPLSYNYVTPAKTKDGKQVVLKRQFRIDYSLKPTPKLTISTQKTAKQSNMQKNILIFKIFELIIWISI